MIYPYLPWDFIGIYTRVRMFTLHALPIFFSLSNIHLSDMKLVESDSKKVFYFGMAYLVANGIGTYETGAPIYPVADWKSIPLTFFLYTLNAVLMAVFFKYAAKFVNNKLPFISKAK
mmetsp:Transcript_13545/g.23057  ORF Transcript_13545/g.23057 Transcript_13545/m.23057 type:complete len:117 (-) Transcript_13545:65-415(-)|eukprot:CAMPEP_0168612724 /NCGR_PEP_ID=MMETSP0449_2-20121227/3068_1 /TAXON_ID=1082188 /ORGANISM="Strombidium rassoulzadegani, Strain ras09" /LENGTH=116 /DNA_ID=CAMNT_0008653305 /DNA_START=455 /DNA_END=805 /DNA_ORIENTATION=+